MSCPRAGHAAWYSKEHNKIVVLGGIPTEDGAPTNSIEVYDIANDKWTT